jgi:hypothetical protein
MVLEDGMWYTSQVCMRRCVCLACVCELSREHLPAAVLKG